MNKVLKSAIIEIAKEAAKSLATSAANTIGSRLGERAVPLKRDDTPPPKDGAA